MKLSALAAGLLLAAPALAQNAPDYEALTRAAVAALDARDLAGIERHYCPDGAIMRPDGVLTASSVSAPAIARMASGRPGTVRHWDAIQSRRIGDDAAVVVAATRLKGDYGEAATQLTATWLARGGKPCLAFLQRAAGGVAAVAATWDEAFQTAIAINREPNRWLMQAVGGAKPGRALDVASGQGRNAVALAKAGWTVTAVDVSGEGLRLTNEAARAAGTRVETAYADVFAFDFGAAKWDLVAFIYSPLRGLEQKAFAGLKPGGLVVAEAFGNAAEPGRANQGVFWKPGEMKSLLERAGFQIVAAEEVDDVADYGRQKVRLVRIVARKP